MIGEFAEKDGDIEVSEEAVAALNGKTIYFSNKQLYAPKMGFRFMTGDGQVLQGREILRSPQ